MMLTAPPPENSAYQYEPLAPGRSIRLVKIAHDVNSPNGLSLRLQQFSLEQAPPFHALSYTWGHADFEGLADEDDGVVTTTEVDCNGQALSVGANLRDFLCRARDSGRYCIDSPDQPVATTPERTSSKYTSDTNLTVPTTELGVNPSQVVGPGSARELGANDVAAINDELRSCWLWADAICIDQSNDGERTHQVQLMGAIYRAAKRPVVWLGDNDPPEDFMWVHDVFVPALDKAFNKMGRQWFENTRFDLRDDRVEALLSTAICERWRRSWIPCFNFLRRKRWYSRGWVVQEVVFRDSNQIIVFCGETNLQWTRIPRLINIMNACNWRTIMNDVLISHGGWSSAESAISRLHLSIRRWLLFGADRLHLPISEAEGPELEEARRFEKVLRVLMHMASYSFTDARDHIYGTLGIIQVILGNEFTFDIPPVYDSAHTVESVFAATTAILLQKMPSFDVLAYSHTLSGPRKTLPSWVPDYSREKSRAFDSYRTAHGRIQVNFDAALTSLNPNGKQDFFNIINQGKTLVLKGACFDRLPAYSSWHACYQSCSTASLKWGFGWLTRRLYGDSSDVYKPTNESVPEAILRTLMTDFASQLLPRDAILTHGRQWFKTIIANTISSRPSSDYTTAALRNNAGTLQQCDPRLVPPLSEIFAAVDAHVDGAADVRELRDNPLFEYMQFPVTSNLVATKKGNLCMAPWNWVGGDEIWLLKGCKTPFLLRKVAGSGKRAKNRYRIVGEVYVHGFMHGEMMTPQLEKRIRRVGIT
ncbi:heterokaryon incompatibility protein-domain-containing protein [Lasiosphaeria hispida]|uniref:Heterokaryon incompatibility protein-domain-containing protein n=1 Tax=Lasiosphaeria hispida TaxID=260671 RepID=A0AAJ0HK61_9PEZI|nr:heterokaryon incompatibility protein-domain-containing protein [Lasiosphaeria hispida]